jgi:hypothetical protein
VTHMTTPNYDPVVYWVKERERIRVQKESNAPYPWTQDAILQEYRFCNVRREDDLVTRWIKQYIRIPYAEAGYLWLMLCIARQINWPHTLAELIDSNAWPVNDKFDPRLMTEVLDDRQIRDLKNYTGAYMISAPAKKGANKNQYICEQVIGDLWRRREIFSRMWKRRIPYMRFVHEWIMESHGWGQFMAYQAVVDMRFTRLLRGALDVDKWAAAGPGTIRGLNRVYGRGLDAALSQADALVMMRELYPLVLARTGVHMDFSDVPNILCETDKYQRIKNNEGRVRALYVPGRGC